jgi:ribonuclease BN (tRNA processing enzyme)
MQQPGFTYLQSNGCINYRAIRRIFVTHLHGDHIGGLEELATLNVHSYGPVAPATAMRPDLFASPETLVALWENSLSGALGVIHGRRATLQDYFVVRPVHPPGRGAPDYFELLGRYRFQPVATDHIRIQRPYDWPSYGLRIIDQGSGRTALYSGDTRFDPAGLGSLMADAAMIFHEVQLGECAEPVHALLRELRTLPEAVRRRMILYHFGDEWGEPAYATVPEEFAGFAEPGKRYVVFP